MAARVNRHTLPRSAARSTLLLDVRGGGLMTAEYPQGDEPLIPMPALSLPALRQAVAAVAPSRLPEFFQEIQDAFTQAGDEDSVFPIRHFYQRWGAAIAIERRPSAAARLHAAERALADPDPTVRDQAGQPIGIRTFEQALTDDASMPAAQQEPNDIAGIVVALSLNG